MNFDSVLKWRAARSKRVEHIKEQNILLSRQCAVRTSMQVENLRIIDRQILIRNTVDNWEKKWFSFEDADVLTEGIDVRNYWHSILAHVKEKIASMISSSIVTTTNIGRNQSEKNLPEFLKLFNWFARNSPWSSFRFPFFLPWQNPRQTLVYLRRDSIEKRERRNSRNQFSPYKVSYDQNRSPQKWGNLSLVLIFRYFIAMFI